MFVGARVVMIAGQKWLLVPTTSHEKIHDMISRRQLSRIVAGGEEEGGGRVVNILVVQAG